MKPNLYHLALFLLTALTSFCGCADYVEGITPDVPETVVPEKAGINLKTKEIWFDASGMTMGLDIRAIDSKWQAYPGETCAWLEKISPEEGEAGNNVIGITLTENEGLTERSTFMIVKHVESGDTLHVKIRQYTHESKYSRETDSLALTAMYLSLNNSSEWQNPWDFKQPVTTWKGLEFAEISGEQRLVAINMREFQMYGELPFELGNLRELKKITFAGGSLTGRFPSSITSLRKLEEINITLPNNYAEWFFPENMGDMKSLKVLNIGTTKMDVSAFKNVYQVTTLEKMTVKGFEGDLPEGIPALVNLKMLDMSSSRVLSLPADFGNLSALEDLNFNSCAKLTELCDNFGQLARLNKLQVYGANKLEALPASFGQLQALTTLNLSSCLALKSLPENFGQLQALNSLTINSCTGLESLSESFSNLTLLTTLNLSGCSKLQQLPSQIGNLNVTEVNLSGCSALTTLPESFAGLTKVTKLTLSNCTELTTLPASIGEMKALTETDLSGCNKLTNLPESFGSLTNLKKFTFTTSGSVALPASFGNLTNLEEFLCSKYGASGEGITGDLSVFATLTKLKNLKASYNSLSGNLSALSSLPNLLTIELIANKLTGTLDFTQFLTNKMTIVSLSENGLSGTLAGITEGTALTQLKLAKNKISGTLPEDIDKCSKLTTLDLSYNLITGNLPVALINLNLTYGGLLVNKNNMSGTIDDKIINSTGWKSKWYPATNIIPQNEGYGFSGF